MTPLTRDKSPNKASRQLSRKQMSHFSAGCERALRRQKFLRWLIHSYYLKQKFMQQKVHLVTVLEHIYILYVLCSCKYLLTGHFAGTCRSLGCGEGMLRGYFTVSIRFVYWVAAICLHWISMVFFTLYSIAFSHLFRTFLYKSRAVCASSKGQWGFPDC
jgi:hypothetical protein